MKTNKIKAIGLAMAIGAGAALSSCVDTDSNLVDFGPSLDSPTDTVYSLLGIMGKMQIVADRTVILGELMGDLTTPTEAATSDLKALSSFTATTDNRYNAPEDYYAIIQNCNYYIAHADTLLSLRGENVFIREYAAIKTFRAWAYLQLAIYYGRVPFFTQPLMTEEEADPSRYPHYDVKQICEQLIPDLEPYVETDYPLGNMETYKDRFIPVRVMLGDLCLWAGRYREAAQYYHDFLTHADAPLVPHATATAEWSAAGPELWQSVSATLSSGRHVSRILMQSSEYDGIVGYLDDVFNSTEDNNYYYQATGSQALTTLSQSQRYTLEYQDPSTRLLDTLYAPETLESYANVNLKGDLRYYARVAQRTVGATDGFSRERQEIFGISTGQVVLYEPNTVYLRMAEAYNRAGLPQSAFAVLKYGLSTSTVAKYISADEQARAGSLLTWSRYYFTTHDMVAEGESETVKGIHANGSGDTYADSLYYVIPELPTREDSILYVEDLILDEMALEQMFWGHRFGDLQRIALRRGDNGLLARKIASRDNVEQPDPALLQRLSDRENWYLPLE